MDYPMVIIVGGAPLSGKTTMAHRLATRLGYACIAVDDAIQAVRAVTTAETHPDFHVMHGWDHRDYYAQRSVAGLVEDGMRQHRATWPVVEELVRVHALYRGPAVIEGWGILPEFVSQCPYPSVAALWLVVDEKTIETRLRGSGEFLSGASQPEKMISGFLGRSLWLDRTIREQARRLGMLVLPVPQGATAEDLATAALELLAHRT